MKIEHICTAGKPSQLPPANLPEVVIIGRSNVGKSSLINAICNNSKLARTSSTPGRTQLAFYFEVNEQVCLVDLPGYGFSATGKSNRQNWQELVEAAVSRPSVNKAMFLIDGRRKLNDEDRGILSFIGQVPVILVMTKGDKAKQSEVSKNLAFITAEANSLGVQIEKTFTTSTLKKKGIQELRELLIAPKNEKQSPPEG